MVSSARTRNVKFKAHPVGFRFTQVSHKSDSAFLQLCVQDTCTRSMYARKRLGQTVHLFCKSNTAQVRASLPSDFPDPPLKARRDDPSVMVWYESSGMSEDSQLQTLGVEGSIHSESSSQLEWGGYGEAPLHQSGKVQSAGFSRLTAARRKFEETISAQKAPTRISCGSEFTLVVTADGCVYACGRCDRGQLGVKGMKDRYAPTLVTTLHGKRVSDVACGREHAFAIVEVQNYNMLAGTRMTQHRFR